MRCGLIRAVLNPATLTPIPGSIDQDYLLTARVKRGAGVLGIIGTPSKRRARGTGFQPARLFRAAGSVGF